MESENRIMHCLPHNTKTVLSPELMLRVAEHVIKSDPGAIRSLMLTSKVGHHQSDSLKVRPHTSIN